MSTPAAKQQTQKKAEYDEAKLSQMTPPLTVTVEKIVAGRRQPIELPIKPGENIAGQGWSQDDVRELPTFLGRRAVGAGIVAIKVTDVNNVAMAWEWFFSPQDYERLAAPSNDPTVASLAAVPPPIQQQPVGPTAFAAPIIDQYSGWLGTVSRQPQQIPGGMQPAGTYRPLAQQQQGAVPMYPQLAPVPAAPLVGGSDDRLREEREARLRLEGEISRKDLENRYKEQLSGVSNEVRTLAGQIGQVMQLVQAPRAEEAASATVRAMEAKIASLEAAAREDKITAMIAAQAMQTQQMIQAMQANTERQIAAITAQVAAKPSGPDPVITMMMEMNKQAQQSQMQFMQMMQSQNASQLGPRDWIDITRSMNTGAEQQATAFSKAWELMMQGVETILHAQGPGTHPAVDMIQQGIAAAAGMVKDSADAKKEVGMAQAQAMAMQAQAQAQLAGQLAMRNQLAGQAAPQQPLPPPPKTEEELQDEADQANADQADADDQNETEQQQQAEASTNERPEGVRSGAARPAPIVDAESQAARKKADKEMFGLALPSIQKLRKKVRDGEFDQQQAAASILKGVDEIMKLKVKVPVMELWANGQLADVLDLMLPDATMKFREQVIEHIVAFVQQAQAAAQAQASGAGAQR